MLSTSHDISFCNTTDNNCPKRKKCRRYVSKRDLDPDALIWFDENWDLYGRFCEEFLERGPNNETLGG